MPPVAVMDTRQMPCLLCTEPPTADLYDDEVLCAGGWTWAAELARRIGAGREIGRRLLSRTGAPTITHGRLRLMAARDVEVALHDRLYGDGDPGPLVWAPRVAHPSARDPGSQQRFDLLVDAGHALRGCPPEDRWLLVEYAITDLIRRDRAFAGDQDAGSTFLLACAAHRPCPPPAAAPVHVALHVTVGSSA